MFSRATELDDADSKGNFSQEVKYFYFATTRAGWNTERKIDVICDSESPARQPCDSQVF